MVPANQPHGASLGAFLPLLLNEDYFGPNLQTLKGLMHDAVTVEVNLPAVGCLDEAIALSREKLAHPAVRRNLMSLDSSAAAAHVVFQLSPCCVEGVPQRHFDVPVLFVLTGLASHSDLFTRQGEVDPYLVEVALLVVLAGRLHHDPTAHDVASELIQPLRLLPDEGLDGLRMFHVPEGNL